MFGLEEQDKKKKAPQFRFDLEHELQQDEQKKKETLDHVENKIQLLKSELREGLAVENRDQCGVLLQGYASLKTVIVRSTKEKIDQPKN